MANERPTNSKLDELFANRPGASASSDRLPIGVDEDYSVTRKKTPRNGFGIPKGLPRAETANPRYFEGDELRPQRNSWSPTQIADLQSKMREAGLLKGKFRLGYWDAASQEAYKALLTYANQSGRDAGFALNELRTHPINAGDEPERPPLVLKTTSPDDLRGVFRDTSRKLLGRALADSEIDKYIAAYNAAENQYDTQAYNLAETGGTLPPIAAPTPYIEERLRREKPQEYKENFMLERYNSFLDLLGQG